MTRVISALIAYLRTAGAPVYTQGCVPESAQPPYLTLTAPMGAFCATAMVTALCYCGGANANADRNALLDTLAALIPQSGHALLVQGGGLLVLYRGSGDFLSAYADPADPGIQVGRCAIEAHYYL